MHGSAAWLAATVEVVIASGGLLGEVTGPSALVDAPGPVRASAAFALVVLLGGALLWRHEGFVADSIDATLARPLWAMGYGVASHAVIAFAAFYLASQLALVGRIGLGLATLTAIVGGLLVLASGATGFTVVGVAVTDLWGAGSYWPGVVLGALLAGGIAGLDLQFAAVGWVAVVSFGIGGAVREWLHASAVQEI